MPRMVPCKKAGTRHEASTAAGWVEEAAVVDVCLVFSRLF